MVSDLLSESAGIDFILAGGATTGLGHVVRCATLASEASRRGWSFRAFIDGDPVALDRWQVLTGSRRVHAWSEWRPVEGHRIVALDHPGPKSQWLDTLEAAGARALVIDDASERERAAWTLLPALHHMNIAESDSSEIQRIEAGERGGALLAGPSYAILSRAHLEQPPRERSARSRLLLSMGGADPLRITPRIAPLIERALRLARQPHGITGCDVVLGPAFEDPEDFHAERLRSAGWQVHRALDGASMAQLMACARLAVFGFGISLTELAWHETPFLSMTHHEYDRAAARDLESIGIGRSLGFAGSLDPDRVVGQIRTALEDHAWQSDSAQRAHRLLEDGRGVHRIFDRLALDA